MSSFALGLVLSSAVLHAVWNLLIKRAGKSTGVAFVWLVSSLSGVIFAPVAITVLILQKPSLGFEEFFFIGGSAVLHIGYHLMLSGGYRIGDLSLVYPLARGTGPMLSTAAAIIFFHERPTGLALAGTVLIGLGVIVISGGKHHQSGHNSYRSIAYALITGICIAMYTLWDKYAVGELLILPIIFTWVSSLYRSLFLSLFARSEWAQVKNIWRNYRFEVLGVAFLSPLSYFLILVALVFSPVSYIAPARELSILIGVTLGSRLLLEGDIPRRLLAAGAIMMGVIFLALG
jgi:drug/metabolite transporter (DMT)-like permease